MTDGLTLGPKRRWRPLLRRPRRSRTSPAQPVQQLLPLFGQRLRGPGTPAPGAARGGQRQQPGPLSFLRDSCLSLAGGCTPVKTHCWEVTGLGHAATSAHHRFLSRSDLGRYRVSGSTKNTSYCCLLGCKTAGHLCRHGVCQRGEALQRLSSPPGEAVSLLSSAAAPLS